MNPDSALICAILNEGIKALKVARERGIKSEMLQGEVNQKALKFLLEFNGKYGGVPSFDALQGYTNFDVTDVPQEPATFFIDFVQERALHVKLQEAGGKLADMLQKGEPGVAKEAMEYLETTLRDIRRDSLTQSRVESLFLYGNAVREYYEQIKNGVRGIQTPWPSVNDATLGFWPMDLVLFVARVGIGKTWTALQLARHAWKQGKKVLIATTEISKLRIAQRFLALELALPYSEFRSGRLSLHKEEHFFKGIEALSGDELVQVVGGNFDFSVENFALAVEDVRPDLIVFDGAYLLRVHGANRTERAANAFDELKRLANRYEVPMVVTHQFNREVKANDAQSVKTESIGLTDVAAWNADVIYALIQTEDMRKEKKLNFKPLKVREGVGEEVIVRWDLDNMAFDELGVVSKAGAGGDADEFDGFVPPSGGGTGGGSAPGGGLSDDVPF